MSLFLDDGDFRLYVGNVEEQLASMPAASVHMVVTSPPYYALRDYDTAEWEGGDPEHEHVANGGRNSAAPSLGGGRAHVPGAPHRGSAGVESCECGAVRIDEQLGLEPTLGEYIDRLVGIFREVARVLRPDGTVWLNLGDTFNAYNGNRGITGSTLEGTRQHVAGRPELPTGAGLTDTAFKPKDKMLVPHRVAIALQDDGWYVRMDNVWWKKNAMPESADDRPTNAHEFVFLLSRSRRYYYDGFAIRDEAEWDRWGAQTSTKYAGDVSGSKAEMVQRRSLRELGETFDMTKKNARSVWEINTVPFPEAHFAVFPPELPTKCIMAGSSEHGVCGDCGAPWEREIGRDCPKCEGFVRKQMKDCPHCGFRNTEWRDEREVVEEKLADDFSLPGRRVPVKTDLTPRSRWSGGWVPTCEHKDAKVVPATVMDIFMGSGTTARVARSLGRHCVGVELSAKYAAMIVERTSQLGLLT